MINREERNEMFRFFAEALLKAAAAAAAVAVLLRQRRACAAPRPRRQLGRRRQRKWKGLGIHEVPVEHVELAALARIYQMLQKQKWQKMPRRVDLRARARACEGVSRRP